MSIDQSIDILSQDQPLMFRSVYSTFLSVPQLSDPIIATTTEGISLTFRYPQPVSLDSGLSISLSFAWRRVATIPVLGLGRRSLDF